VFVPGAIETVEQEAGIMFAFTAEEGETYQLDTELGEFKEIFLFDAARIKSQRVLSVSLAVALYTLLTMKLASGTLGDTTMKLLEMDGETVIVENDDDERETDRLDSYIEWTCPAAGTYYVEIGAYAGFMGTFQLKITKAEALGGGGNPCTNGGEPGATMTEDAAVISFQPEGNYDDDNECKWTVTCVTGGPVTVVFEQLETEEDYDFVQVYDGAEAVVGSPSLSDRLSGNLEDLSEHEFVSTGESLTV
jgi:hypothetical protein